MKSKRQLRSFRPMIGAPFSPGYSQPTARPGTSRIVCPGPYQLHGGPCNAHFLVAVLRTLHIQRLIGCNLFAPIAPPCERTTRPLPISESRSARAVTADTPKRAASPETVMRPSRLTISRTALRLSFATSRGPAPSFGSLSCISNPVSRASSARLGKLKHALHQISISSRRAAFS